MRSRHLMSYERCVCSAHQREASRVRRDIASRACLLPSEAAALYCQIHTLRYTHSITWFHALLDQPLVASSCTVSHPMRVMIYIWPSVPRFRESTHRMCSMCTRGCVDAAGVYNTAKPDFLFTAASECRQRVRWHLSRSAMNSA